MYNPSQQVNEVDLIMCLFNRLDDLPELKRTSSSKDVREVLELIDYLEKHYINCYEYEYSSKPFWYGNQPTVKQIEDEQKKIENTSRVDLASLLDRKKSISYLVEKVKKGTHDDKMLWEYMHDVNFGKFKSMTVYDFVDRGNYMNPYFNVYELVQENFIERVANHFKNRYKAYKHVSHFSATKYFFDKFTISQLELMAKKLDSKGYNIWKTEQHFVEVYFQKAFNKELSKEHQDNLSL
jgi:hypothetical protein